MKFPISAPLRALPLAGAVLLLALAPGLDAAAKSKPLQLVIGVLPSLTGSWSTLGKATVAATADAAADVNAEFAALGVPTRVKLLVEDTKLDPDRALVALKRLAGKGVRVVIGPQSSAEARALEPYARQRGILLVSQGSTAGSLAVANDNLFRFCPADTHEGEAAAALLHADGIQAMVPIWRADAGNQGLHTSTSAEFQQLGGSVYPGVEYAADSPNFAKALPTLGLQVRQAIAQFGAAHVGVYLASFDETVELFHLAAQDSVLASVKWYGGDGVVQSQVLQQDAQAAQFAAQVGFPCPTFGLDDAAKSIWQPLSDRITKQIGYAPDAFGLAAYDAVWVAALANEEAPTRASISQRRLALERNADRYFGATGWTEVDAAGDRALGNYDFYALQNVGGSYEWRKVAQYAAGRLSRQGVD